MLCRGETWTYNSGFGDGLGNVNCPPGLIFGDLPHVSDNQFYRNLEK